jgi:hypothetical protein
LDKLNLLLFLKGLKGIGNSAINKHFANAIHDNVSIEEIRDKLYKKLRPQRQMSVIDLLITIKHYFIIILFIFLIINTRFRCMYSLAHKFITA